MSNSNKLIRSALKRILVPHFETEGFSGKFPEFRRKENGVLHLLSVQFDKWDGGFFLEFAPHAAGEKKMSWSEVVPENELMVVHAPFNTRARLQECGGENSTAESWFRFDGLSKEECEGLVGHIIQLFPQVNEWLREKRVGPNISTI